MLQRTNATTNEVTRDVKYTPTMGCVVPGEKEEKNISL
jgi:hypothetical protein